ncbi:hypothetical protein Fmac_032752 [Flemingia macrophylla]|uniref:Glycoside hydrolase family 19 catalytic domain-containing protein n=1 Tax=Flemingia macrophylla TaxID=520843 RepID=A0ABD1L5T8_9FABA
MVGMDWFGGGGDVGRGPNREDCRQLGRVPTIADISKLVLCYWISLLLQELGIGLLFLLLTASALRLHVNRRLWSSSPSSPSSPTSTFPASTPRSPLPSPASRPSSPSTPPIPNPLPRSPNSPSNPPNAPPSSASPSTSSSPRSPTSPPGPSSISTSSPPHRPAHGDLGSIISRNTFEQMLKHRNDRGCQGKGFYSYDAFISAAKAFPAFGITGYAAARKMEIAAFFDQTSHKTTGGWASAPDRPYA